MAYAQIYQVKQLMPLYPHHTELGRDEGTVCNYRICGTDDVGLTIATISLLDLAIYGNRPLAAALCAGE